MPATDTATYFSRSWDALRSPDLPLREPPAAPGERWLVGPDVDLFNPILSDPMRDRAQAFAVMALRPDVTFLLLTGEPKLAAEYLGPMTIRWHEWLVVAAGFRGCNFKVGNGVDESADFAGGRYRVPPNALLGVTVATQADADRLLPELLRVPAVRWWVDFRPTEVVNLALDNWVWLRAPVRGDWPIGEHVVAESGLHRAVSNRHGALSVRTPDGLLGIKPGEFERRGFAWLAIPDVPGLDLAGVRSAVDQCRRAGVSVWCGPEIDGELVRQGPDEVVR